MTLDLSLRRQFFAEDLQAICNLRTPGLVDAFASVPREAFLGPGPWLVTGEGDIMGAGPRRTPDADPRHVYHNLSVAIDPDRMLFNGAPGVVSLMIDALALRTGARVLHVGAGLGYYTAVLAHCVGPRGRVLALEVDERLASQARANLASFRSVEVRREDASREIAEAFDAVLFSAGVTHPHEAWLDALSPGGRLVLPLTASFSPVAAPAAGRDLAKAGPEPGSAAAAGNIGKGPVVAITRSDDGATCSARVVTFIAIYSGIGIRDEAMNARLGDALKKNPLPRLKSLRRDRHSPDASCWLHGETWCFRL